MQRRRPLCHHVHEEPVRDGWGTPAQTNEFQLRLDEMDKRLHDILDVMIALSEKFDRWEAEPSRDPAVRS